jgi:adenylate kinase family enzyme
MALRAPVAVCCLLGGPGAGKSTLCQMLVSEVGGGSRLGGTPAVVHLSSGELLREAVVSQAGILLRRRARH